MALPQNLFLKQIWPIKIGHPRENENVSPIFAGGYFHGKTNMKNPEKKNQKAFEEACELLVFRLCICREVVR
jgi:hypothetical protein